MLICDFAMQEPALAIAPVFLVLQKKSRDKLNVTSTFGDATLQWRGPSTLGMQEQSVLLGILSIAGQQTYFLNPQEPAAAGRKLLERLSLSGPGSLSISTRLAVVKTTWTAIAIAAGYVSIGGRTRADMKAAVGRLAKTTISEKSPTAEFQTQLLAWITGTDDTVMIVLNQRATSALRGGQYSFVSIAERNTLKKQDAKALHAWLSGYLRAGNLCKIRLETLHKHVWCGDATDYTLRARRKRLIAAINEITALTNWTCTISSAGLVNIVRRTRRRSGR
jgi:hypothetical protein